MLVAARDSPHSLVDTSPNAAFLVHRPDLVGPGCFAAQSLPAAGGAAVVLVGIDRCCAAGADAGDDVGGVGVAPIAFVVGVGVAAGALVVDAAAVLVVVVVVAAAAVPAVAASEGSMTHMVRDGCWVQLVLKVLTVAVEVEEVALAVAAVAGDENDTADCGTMNYASGRIVAADSAHGSSARLGKKAAKTAEESYSEIVGTWSTAVVSRATDVVLDLVEEGRPNCAWFHEVETCAAAADWPGRKLVAVAAAAAVVVAALAGEAEVILQLYLASVPVSALSGLRADTAERRSKMAEAEA